LNRTLATACLICLPLGAAAQDDDGPGYLTRLLQDNLSGDERIVNIQGFQGALSSEATVARLTVADSDGVWLTMETSFWTGIAAPCCAGPSTCGSCLPN